MSVEILPTFLYTKSLNYLEVNKIMLYVYIKLIFLIKIALLILLYNKNTGYVSTQYFMIINY